MVGEQAQGPGTDVFVIIAQLHVDPVPVNQPGGVEAPQGPQAAGHIGVLVKAHQLGLYCPGIDGLRFGPFLQEAPRPPHPPVVFEKLQLHQLQVVELVQIERRLLLNLPVGHLVDSPAGAVHPVAVVALSMVTPVEQIDRPVGAVLQLHSTIPVAGGVKKILPVPCHVTRPAPFQDLLVHAPAVGVVHEDPPSILPRPIVAEIDHPAAMQWECPPPSLSVVSPERPWCQTLA